MPTLPSKRSTRSLLRLCSLIVITSSMLSGCDRPSALEQVQTSGELHIITRNSPTTYYLDREGPTGFEYTLAKLFADKLGVELKVSTADALDGLFTPLLSFNQRRQDPVNLAAANLSITESREQRVTFGPSYDQINLQLVYNRRQSAPKSLKDLHGDLLILKGSSHEERLAQLQLEYGFKYRTSTDLEVVDLLKMVNDGDIAYTIIDSNALAMNQLFFPNIKVAFDIPPGEKLAWAFPLGDDDSLRQEADQFFQELEKSGKLNQLRERFYGHLDQLNYVGAKTYVKQINQRLPNYQAMFQEVADELDLDWRLLAAIGYQESHWRPRAKSPTGVRGMMMLTLSTAKEMKVSNRLDAEQSIRGGAKYFLKIKARLPDRIEEPDSTWLALAAYNVGLGHLEDARVITQRQGGDPDKWVDVKERLPLLSKREWYKDSRYGYARGYEPVLYVQNIRRYYSILQWLTNPPTEALAMASELTPGLVESTTPTTGL